MTTPTDSGFRLVAFMTRTIASVVDTPATRSARIDALRFGVGDAVECRVDGGWHAGKVIALLYRDECMPAGVVAPYQARFIGSL